MTTADRRTLDMLDAITAELAQWDAHLVERIHARLADARAGFPTGTDGTSSLRYDDDGNVVTDLGGRAISYSDRTGDAVANHTADQAGRARLNLLHTLHRIHADVVALRTLRQDWGTISAVACCQAHLRIGMRVPVARGRYERYCRSCGEAVARNDGQMTPPAILHAIACRQPLSPRLLDANPMPNGKRYKP